MDMSLWRTLSHCAGRGLPREAVMRECLLAAACCRLLQYFPMSHRCGDIHLIPHFWYKAPPSCRRGERSNCSRERHGSFDGSLRKQTAGQSVGNPG